MTTVTAHSLPRALALSADAEIIARTLHHADRQYGGVLDESWESLPTADQSSYRRQAEIAVIRAACWKAYAAAEDATFDWVLSKVKAERGDVNQELVEDAVRLTLDEIDMQIARAWRALQREVPR